MVYRGGRPDHRQQIQHSSNMLGQKQGPSSRQYNRCHYSKLTVDLYSCSLDQGGSGDVPQNCSPDFGFSFLVTQVTQGRVDALGVTGYAEVAPTLKKMRTEDRKHPLHSEQGESLRDFLFQNTVVTRRPDFRHGRLILLHRIPPKLKMSRNTLDLEAGEIFQLPKLYIWK